MTSVPKGFTKVDERKIMEQGNSLVASIPRQILKNAGAWKGSKIDLYQKDNRFVLIDLKPDEE